jgi:hypothetical protein
MKQKMIQIRHVPEDLHRKLKARAANAGMPLSDYLLREIRRVAEQPTIEELWERIKRRRPPEGPIDSVSLIREERDTR